MLERETKERLEGREKGFIIRMDGEQQAVDNVAREERDIDKEVRLREWNVKRKENKVKEARYNKVI